MKKSTEVKVIKTFIEDVAKMMYVFGDSRNPLEDTAKIVENFTRNYIIELV